MTGKLDRKMTLELTFRTFFIRLFYNYNNLFGEGLCFCIIPFFRKNSSGCDIGSEIITRHLRFFNTNEYLSGFALGIILRNEKNDGTDGTDIDKIKEMLSSVLGSVGDGLVYRTIYPVAVLTMLNKFVISGFIIDPCSLYMTVFLVLFFNIFNFWIRYYGIRSGFEKGTDALRVFRHPSFLRSVKFLTALRNILALSLVINLIINAKALNILLFF